MADRVFILYPAPVDAFYPQPTPYVTVEEQTIFVGERWGVVENVTLNGQITGCSFSGIVAGQTLIRNSFNRSFQTLQVWQQTGAISGLIFDKPLSEVTNVSFPQARMFGVQDYSISLTCYPSGLFSGAYGVLKPQDVWSYEERENEVLNAVHTISCQPFNTSSGPSNALDNARSWAFGRTGTQSAVAPAFISGVAINRFVLLTQNENVDRFNGTYSLTQTYTNDLARSGQGVIRYSTVIQSGANGITVSLDGSSQNGDRNISGARAAFQRLDKLAIATTAYQSAFARNDLNPNPITQSFNEDPFTATVDFNYAFDNSNLPSVWFDYTVDLNVGTNGLIEASIQGTVRARGGSILDRLARCQAYAATVNLYNLVLPFYGPFDVSSITPLNPVPITSGQAINQSDGTVGLNATYSNKTQVSVVLDEFNYTINFIPSRYQVDSQPVLDGLGTYSAVNLNYANRASIAINGTAVTAINFTAAQGVQAVEQKCFNLFNQYGNYLNATLDQSRVSQSRTDNRALSFDFVWSYGPINAIGPTNIVFL